MSRYLKFLLLLLLHHGLATLGHAQDWARAHLEESPRHREWVTLTHDSRSLHAYVVYPETKQKVTAVVLVHEIFGLSDWAKEMADELAAAGYIVVAPDLLSGMGPKSGGTTAFASQEDTVKAVSGLNADVVTADLDSAAEYARKLPSSNGKLAVAGFCWGGGKTFLFATHRQDLAAAFVFYGPPPPDVSTITAPVYGFYAGNDARIDVTLPDTTAAMKAAGKSFAPVIYDGAGHGFMRAGEDPAPTTTEANKKARREGFARLTTLLSQIDSQKSSTMVPAAKEPHRSSSPETLACEHRPPV